jgi:hypothetical protein
MDQEWTHHNLDDFVHHLLDMGTIVNALPVFHVYSLT